MWQSISLDFITDLTDSKGFNAILTVVDRYAKMAYFVPCTKEITSEETVGIVMREVFWHHGLPDSIISDRDRNSCQNFGSISSKFSMSLATFPPSIIPK